MKRNLWENTQLVNKTFPINVFHTQFEPHNFLTLHWHEHFEIIVIEQGEADLQVGALSFTAKAGEIIVVNSGELHAISQPVNGFTFYAIVFHPSLISLQSADLQTLDLISPYTAGQKKFITRISQDDEHFALLRQTLFSLIGEFQGQLKGYEHAVKALCQLLFTWCYRWFTEEQEQSNQLRAFGQKAERFKELLHYIEEHYREGISLVLAANIVHLSLYHFCKTFKKLTGMTFVQFVNLYRIQEAERLLMSTSLTVTEISESIGCGSINGFSKLFKQYKGFSPKQYRLNAN
jgi:AraC family transcriptional activator of pobA